MLFKGNSSSLQLLIEKLQSNKEHTEQDTLGTEGGSSWASEDHTTSPGSSCTTPNSTTEAPDSELSFTVGVTDGTPHACRFCDKAFPRHSYLKKHEQTHADCMPFRCEYCQRLFKHKRSRDRHIKLHTGDKKYRCSQCDAAFSRSDHLKIHMKTHDNQKPFQCTVCNRGYNTAAALTSHMQNHKRPTENISSSVQPGTTFKCLQCAELFPKPEELQNHMNSHQLTDTTSNSNNRSAKPSSFPIIRLTCTYCTKDNFSTMDALQSHVQSAHKSILSGDLHRELTNSVQQQKPPTSVPMQPLNSMTSLTTNQLFTTALPSYYCELCTMRFSSLQALQKHTNAVHGFANNTYNSLKYLMMPELINNGKLYCVYCAMHFLTPASFAEHYIIFHSPYHPQILCLNPPEQVKATDLTMSRKTSPIKRTTPDEHRSSPRKKSKITNENVSLLPNLNNNRYEYSGTLLCSQCNAAFTDFESFRAHIKLHIEETSGGLLGGATPPERKRTPVEFTCPHCRAVFSSSEEISQHVVNHFLATSTEYSCENCHKTFEKADELQKHLMEIHAHHLYSCSICNEVFDSKVAIQVHFAVRHSHEAKVYRCTGCPTSTNVYHSELEFATHVKTIHTNNSSSLTTFKTHHNSHMLRCFICHMSLPSELDMQLHLATHGKQFQCTLCSQSFQIEYLLDKHMQNHHSSQQMNGSCETYLDISRSEHSPSISPDNQSKIKTENNDKGNSESCDICEKTEFANETELLAHRKLYHHKTPSPHKHNNDILENSEDRKLSQKHKSSSSSSSPTLRYDNGKKMENGDANGNNNVTSCEICEKRDFANETELASHKKLIHHVKLLSPGKVSLHCAYCNENCKSRTDLENHMKSHSQNSTSSGKHKCIICDEMCPTAAVLAEHKLTHCKVLAGKTCMQCKGSITTEEQFYSHIQQHNVTPSSGNNNITSQQQLILPTVCVICRQTLVSEMEARMHARFHLHQSADLIPCSVCLQMCERQDLIAGICRECYQRHGKSSPFRCPECHIKFDNGTAIEIHLATTHRKSYQCIKCQVSFDNEKEIQQHVATHLVMDGLNGHECRLCRLVLPTPLQLQAHLIEHTFAGCATFTCYLCSSVFTTAQGLQTHILEHGLSARPYDCSQCKQKFFFTSELEHHSYVHLEEFTMHEGEGSYFYRQDKAAHKEKTMQYPPHQTITTPKNIIYGKDQKYTCASCGVNFVHVNDFYDHKNRFHGDHKRNCSFNLAENIAGTDSVEKYENNAIEIPTRKKQDCESEDEQIDVVTTRVEEQDEPNEIKSEKTKN